MSRMFGVQILASQILHSNANSCYHFNIYRTQVAVLPCCYVTQVSTANSLHTLMLYREYTIGIIKDLVLIFETSSCVQVQ